MTQRLSSNQFTIMRAMGPKPDGRMKSMPFDRAVEFNQVLFYSLVRRGYIELNLESERFFLTEDGASAFALYAHGTIEGMWVKNNPPARQERVAARLQSQPKSGRRRKAA
jgi:hypothetical protein